MALTAALAIWIGFVTAFHVPWTGIDVSDRMHGLVRTRSRHATAGLHLLQVVDDRSMQVVRLVHVAQ